MSVCARKPQQAATARPRDTSRHEDHAVRRNDTAFTSPLEVEYQAVLDLGVAVVGGVSQE